jgi:hypothetical protein
VIITGISDIGDKLFTSVNDTGNKLSPVSLLPVIHRCPGIFIADNNDMCVCDVFAPWGLD